MSFTNQRATDSADRAPVVLRAISNDDDPTPLARALSRLGHAVHRGTLAQLPAAEERETRPERPKDIFADAVAMARRQELEPSLVEAPSILRYRPSLGTAAKSAVAAGAAALFALAWFIPNPASRRSADRFALPAFPGEQSSQSSSFAPTRVPAPALVRSPMGSPVQPNSTTAPQPDGSAGFSTVPLTAPAATVTPKRDIQPGEIADFIRRAKNRLDEGDLSAARLLLRRAAEAHDPLAALSLAKTFDPTVSTPSGAASPDADLAQARIWYQKAREWGAAEAQNQIDALANRR